MHIFISPSINGYISKNFSNVLIEKLKTSIAGSYQNSETYVSPMFSILRICSESISEQIHRIFQKAKDALNSSKKGVKLGGPSGQICLVFRFWDIFLLFVG